MGVYGWSYSPAHMLATGGERRCVVKAGIKWDPYVRAFKPYIKADSMRKFVIVTGSAPASNKLPIYCRIDDIKLVGGLWREVGMPSKGIVSELWVADGVKKAEETPDDIIQTMAIAEADPAPVMAYRVARRSAPAEIRDFAAIASGVKQIEHRPGQVAEMPKEGMLARILK
jgi:hypothetical protein